MSNTIFGGVKRKAIAVIPTRCRFCLGTFNDKYYKEDKTHKVICPHCGEKNAEIEFDEAMRTAALWGLNHDIGTGGEFGFHFSYAEIKKFFTEIYGAEIAEKKMQELLYNITMQEKRRKLFEESLKNAKSKNEKKSNDGNY